MFNATAGLCNRTQFMNYRQKYEVIGTTTCKYTVSGAQDAATTVTVSIFQAISITSATLENVKNAPQSFVLFLLNGFMS